MSVQIPIKISIKQMNRKWWLLNGHTCKSLVFSKGFFYSFNFFSVSPDIMLRMGYSLEEIQDSLINQKYNDVMATYLLLDYRNSEVSNDSVFVHEVVCIREGLVPRFLSSSWMNCQ